VVDALSTGFFFPDDDVTREERAEFSVGRLECSVGDRRVTRAEDVVGVAVGIDLLVEQFRRREFDGDAEPASENTWRTCSMASSWSISRVVCFAPISSGSI